MGKRKFTPQIGYHLGNIATILTVVSVIALLVTIITWIYTMMHSDGYSMYDRPSLSSLEAFGFVIYSLEALVASFVLRGFSYIVRAAILYLDEKGEFGED